MYDIVYCIYDKNVNILIINLPKNIYIYIQAHTQTFWADIDKFETTGQVFQT